MNQEDYNSNIDNALEWFMSFMHLEHWPGRMQAIADEIQNHNPKQNSKKENTAEKNLSYMTKKYIRGDKMGWYIYLMQALRNDINRYEPNQGARVAPIFNRIGADLEIVKKIGGIEKKVKQLVKKDKTQADTVLFEILTALLWAKNGWEVSFIEEEYHRKPDIIATKDGEQWFIECKRIGVSVYGDNQREKRLRMLDLVKEKLVRCNVLLEIVFHVELDTLPDSFVHDELFGGSFVVGTNEIQELSTDIWDLRITKLNLNYINSQLQRRTIKNNSPQLRDLIGGDLADSTDFSVGQAVKKYYNVDKNDPTNFYIDTLGAVFGIDWKCDAPISVDKRAKDIWQQLKDATDQFPKEENAVIHLGIETLGGTAVEKARYDKILKTGSVFDSGDKNVRAIYCHFF